MVEAVLRAAPNYSFNIMADLSGGFWTLMAARHPDRITFSNPDEDEFIEPDDPRFDENDMLDNESNLR
jgi:hypothetical protein